MEWLKDPVIAGSTLMFRHKTSETGMIKAFGSYNYNSSSMLYENFQESKFQEVSLSNYNSYINTTYNELLNKNWMLNTGLAFNVDYDDTNTLFSKGKFVWITS
jgi:hypothetical protein